MRIETFFPFVDTQHVNIYLRLIFWTDTVLDSLVNTFLLFIPWFIY